MRSTTTFTGVAAGLVSKQPRLVNRLLLIAFMPFAALAQDNLDWAQFPPLPEPLGVAAPFAGVSGGALIVAGGANFPDKMPWEGGAKAWLNKVWVMQDPEAGWKEAGFLPGERAYGVCVTHRDAVICVGGSDSRWHHAGAFRMTWDGVSLKTNLLPPLPITLAGLSGALVGDTLIVACGAEEPGEQKASNRAFSMDLAAAELKWVELPPLPGKPRIFPTASAQGDTFFLFGGAALEAGKDGKAVRTYLRDAWSYSQTLGWVRLADMPKPLVAAPSPAPLIEGRILLLSGDDGTRTKIPPGEKHPGFPRPILAYYPSRDEWSNAGEVFAPRATVPVVEWRKQIVIPSGEVKPGIRSPQVWSFPIRP